MRAALLGIVMVGTAFCGRANAQQAITIAWDPETNSAVAGYILHYGTASHVYTNALHAGTNTSIKVPNLKTGINYFFSVTAYNRQGVEGTNSPEIMTRTASDSFFNNESALNTTSQYLQFNNGTPFGFFTDNSFPYVTHQDMGKEYVIDAADGKSGVYFFDFTSGHYFYTTPTLFPTMYDLNLKSWLTYYADAKRPGHYTTSPRYFYNQGTKKVITL